MFAIYEYNNSFWAEEVQSEEEAAGKGGPGITWHGIVVIEDEADAWVADCERRYRASQETTTKKIITQTHKVARIFEDVGGYYVCDDSLDSLDARGNGYASKASALRAAYAAGYTHAVGSGAYRDGSILSQVSVTDWDREDHSRAQEA